MHPKLIQHILEIRYEHGYRYLDRCGDALLILEQALAASTGHFWMPADMKPTGALLQCPGLDIEIRFDTASFNLSQTGLDMTADIAKIATEAFAVLVARFDLRSAVRVASRRIQIIGTDSLKEANATASRIVPTPTWLPETSLRTNAASMVLIQESEDESKGYRLEVEAVLRTPEGETKEERARVNTRFLPRGQKTALIDQLKRKQRRENDPVAGVTIDVDYYWAYPERIAVNEVVAEGIDVERAILSNLARKA